MGAVAVFSLLNKNQDWVDVVAVAETGRLVVVEANKICFF
jgi:hypothetical protein